MTVALEFLVLGPLEVRRDDQRLVVTGTRKRLLLATLLTARGSEVSIGALVASVWGEKMPKSAPHAVEVYVSELRSLLGADAIERGELGYAISAASSSVDAARFESLAAKGSSELASGAFDAAAASIGEGLALWRGAAYANATEADPVRAAADRLDELRRLAEAELVDAELALGRHARLVPRLIAQARTDPTDERIARQLMLALYRSGRQAAALEHARALRAALRSELGLEPTRELSDLEQAILRHDGLLHVLDSVPLEPHLPARTTSLVGRGTEILRTRDLLTSRDTRLLTLTGPGGIGKTRLATEVAHAAARDYAQVVFVPLVGVTHRDELDLAIRTGLGTRLPAADSIGARSVLLCLDEFERCLDAAPAVAELLEACPRLDLLVTSRRRLGLLAEHVVEVPVLTEDESVLLYAQRLRSTGAELAAPADTRALCRRLEGLPLAVEHAAAIARTQPAPLLLESLRRRLDLPGVRAAGDRRHATLRATVEYGLELIDDASAVVFRRLSVHEGGGTADAAHAIAGADAHQLATLADASLLQRQGNRFTMLEVVRELGLEQLERSGESDEVRRRHAGYYAALAERLEADAYRSFRSTELVERLVAERPNVRAALAWTWEQAELELHGRLAAALGIFWYLSGSIDEGRRVLAQISDSEDVDAEPWGPRLLATAAELALAAGDPATGASLRERAFAAAGEQHDDPALVRCLIIRALVRERLEDTVADLEEAADLAARCGLAAQVVACRNNLAYLMLAGGQDAEPRMTELAESIAGISDGGVFGVAASMTLAVDALRNGERERAGTLLLDAFDHALTNEAAPEVVWLLFLAAAQRAACNDFALCARIVGAVERFQYETGVADMLAPLEAGLRDEAARRAADALGQPQYEKLLDAGRRLDWERAVELARSSLQSYR